MGSKTTADWIAYWVEEPNRYWHGTKMPNLRLTRDDIVESRDGAVTARMSSAQEPAVRMVNDLLFSLLAGDMTRLTGSFDVVSTVTGKEWQAKLAPRDAGMMRVIGGIDLAGSEFVTHVVIREASGDRTEITFSAITTGKAAMQADEAKQF